MIKKAIISLVRIFIVNPPHSGHETTIVKLIAGFFADRVYKFAWLVLSVQTVLCAVSLHWIRVSLESHNIYRPARGDSLICTEIPVDRQSHKKAGTS